MNAGPRHDLKRQPTTATRTPGLQPPSAYACSCGAKLDGNSRRRARAAHRQHRATLTTGGAA